MIGLASIFTPRFFQGLAILAIVTLVGGAVWAHFDAIEKKDERIAFLEGENATLEANITTLEGAINTQQQTIESLQRDIELQAEIFLETQERFQDARDQVDDLRMRLGRHEIGALGRARPGLVENVINNASDNILRCFEIAAGAELTEAELNATLPSQINRECPDLANPNYRGD